MLKEVERLYALAKKEDIKLFPLDVRSLAEKLGLIVEDYNDLENTEQYSTLTKKETGEIVLDVNQDKSIQKQRLGIAHQIGHTVLQKDFMDAAGAGVWCNGEILGELDAEAEIFAWFLLVPMQQINELLAAKVPLNVNVLADAFEVPRKGMRQHLKRLGFFTKNRDPLG